MCCSACAPPHPCAFLCSHEGRRPLDSIISAVKLEPTLRLFQELPAAPSPLVLRRRLSQRPRAKRKQLESQYLGGKCVANHSRLHSLPYHVKANRSLKLLGKLSEQSMGLFLSNPGFYFVFYCNHYVDRKLKWSQEVWRVSILEMKLLCFCGGRRQGNECLIIWNLSVCWSTLKRFLCSFFVVVITNALFMGSDFHLKCVIWKVYLLSCLHAVNAFNTDFVNESWINQPANLTLWASHTSSCWRPDHLVVFCVKTACNSWMQKHSSQVLH